MTARHYSPRSVAIVTTELTWILGTLGSAIALDLLQTGAPLHMSTMGPQFAAAGSLYIAGFYYADLYNFSELHIRREVVTAALRGFSALAVSFGILFLSTRWLAFHSITILTHLVATTIFIIVLRAHVDGILARYGFLTRIAIVGTGSEAHGLAEHILRRHEYGHEVVCFVGADDAPAAIRIRVPNPGMQAVPVIAPEVLLPFAQEHRVKRILVATADLGAALPVDALMRCKAEGYEIEDGHTFYERLLGRILTAQLRPEWLIFSDGFTRSAGARALKRAIDVVVAVCLLVITAPLCALVAAIIKVEDGGPILFRQTRVGRDAQPFVLRKFRSMRVDAEAGGPQWAEVDDPRVTHIGRWIRALRIDEIPQAWNVLVGEMSFVGPRPERPEFVEQLRQAIPYYDYRHTMRGGITGWAQISFPYGATVEDARQKLEYDLYYLKNFSVLMDVLILLRTFKILLVGWGSR